MIAIGFLAGVARRMNFLGDSVACRMRLPVAALLLVSAAGHAAAHPISVTRADVYVNPEFVRAAIELFVEDLYLFHNLKTTPEERLSAETIQQGIEKHKDFLAERFLIRDLDGELLRTNSIELKAFKVPTDGIAVADLMDHSLTFVLDYALAEPPTFLTFSQQITDDEGLIPSEMQMIVQQERGGWPTRQILLPDEPFTIRFTWEGRPLARGASEAQWQDFYKRQRREALGITDFGAVYSFLYVNRDEVRHEILMPLRVLNESVPMDRDSDEILSVAEQKEARESIEVYFIDGNPIQIDGQPAKSRMTRLEFFRLGESDLAKSSGQQSIRLATGRAGVILSYQADSPPQTVALTWNRFNRLIPNVQTRVLADDFFKKVTFVPPEQNTSTESIQTYQWTTPTVSGPLQFPTPIEVPDAQTFRIPILSLACFILLPISITMALIRRSSVTKSAMVVVLLAAVGLTARPVFRAEVPNPFAEPAVIGPQTAAGIFALLHDNLYRAFAIRDEAAIYDALASSVDGPLLEKLYLSLRRGLEMQEQGSTVARIQNVERFETICENSFSQTYPHQASGGFAVRCRWNVNGDVQHWGHVHSRTNQYLATFAVEPCEGAWKITDMLLAEEKRIASATRIRGL